MQPTPCPAESYPAVELEVIDESGAPLMGASLRYRLDEGDWLEGDLVINEIMVNPNTVGDPSGEWVELFNAGDGNVDVACVVPHNCCRRSWMTASCANTPR